MDELRETILQNAEHAGDVYTAEALAEVARKFPMDMAVRYFPILGGSEFHDCRIASAPWMLGGQPVVKLTGMSGGKAVSHLTIVNFI